MAGEPTTTVVGNLTDEPDLKFTTSQRAVCSFTVASTPRFMKDDKWEDGTTLFQRCNLWGPEAENFVNSAHKGDRVIVTGRLGAREWTDKQEQKRVSVELTVDEIGLSTKFATVTATRVKRSGGRPEQPPTPDDDPWASASKTRPATKANADTQRGKSIEPDWDDEPPF